MDGILISKQERMEVLFHTVALSIAQDSAQMEPHVNDSKVMDRLSAHGVSGI